METTTSTSTEPYYQDDSCTIYLGDCRDICESQTWDIVATDPPYGMQYRSNHRHDRHDPITGDDSYPVEFVRWLIDRTSHASYFFCRWDNLIELPRPKSVLAWVKNNWGMGDLKHEHGRQWEACCFYPGPLHEFTSRLPDVVQANRESSTWHPTQKPVGVMSYVIGCNVGDVVLDPFMGSGTTLLAARIEGRKAIGIEINERYCEQAANRMSQKMLF